MRQEKNSHSQADASRLVRSFCTGSVNHGREMVPVRFGCQRSFCHHQPARSVALVHPFAGGAASCLWCIIWSQNQGRSALRLLPQMQMMCLFALRWHTAKLCWERACCITNCPRSVVQFAKPETSSMVVVKCEKWRVLRIEQLLMRMCTVRRDGISWGWVGIVLVQADLLANFFLKQNAFINAKSYVLFTQNTFHLVSLRCSNHGNKSSCIGLVFFSPFSP